LAKDTPFGRTAAAATDRLVESWSRGACGGGTHLGVSGDVVGVCAVVHGDVLGLESCLVDRSAVVQALGDDMGCAGMTLSDQIELAMQSIR
jgi:hypothetical protein